jgi:hypothetical protein
LPTFTTTPTTNFEFEITKFVVGRGGKVGKCRAKERRGEDDLLAALVQATGATRALKEASGGDAATRASCARRGFVPTPRSKKQAFRLEDSRSSS